MTGVEAAVEAQFVFVDPTIFGMDMKNMPAQCFDHSDWFDPLPKQMTRIEVNPDGVTADLVELQKSVRVVHDLAWVHFYRHADAMACNM